jgi:hypothetical protein
LAAAGGVSAQDRKPRFAGIYPQLMPTVYLAGKPLPAGVKPVTLDLEGLDRAGLPAGSVISSVAKDWRGDVWVATDQGAFHKAGGKFQAVNAASLLRLHGVLGSVDTEIHCIAADADGHLWMGTTTGLYVSDGVKTWHALDRRDGMPIDDVKCLCLAANGDVWGGTEQGAWRLRDGTYRYFNGRRWLPSNEVKRIWEGARNGEIWLETDSGYSLIKEEAMTLARKAREFDDLTQKWNNRHGYINVRVLKSEGDLASGVFHISDNDGLWNSIYVGAMAFRYGATHDAEARKQGWQALNAMLDLERLTGIPGLPARAVVTDAELKSGVGGFDAKETVRIPGETDPIWFRSPVQKDLWCKGDTSSDELDGHYFAWLTYFDLAATSDQKRQIAEVCRRVTDNIIAGGYNLIGHTGRKTRWAIYAPSIINDDPAWADQRGLNSLQMLCYLKIAEHITGDAKYAKRYETLIHDHHYLINTMAYRHGFYGEWRNVNHSDDELAALDFYGMLTLEKNPERRRILLQSFCNTWEDRGVEQPLKPERSPLYNYLYGGLTGRACAPDEAEQSLQDWPWDRVDWQMKNSQRNDVTFKEGRGLRAHNELTRVLPVSERHLERRNGNPWTADGGSNGLVFDDGAAFLVGYWIGVHYGYLPYR